MNGMTIFKHIIVLTALGALISCGGGSGGGATNLDPSFGINGKVTTEFISGSPAQGHAMVIQGDDKIVMGGYAHNGSDYDFALARYNVDGTLDTSFGSAGTGKVMTDFAGRDEQINALAIDGSGRIVVAGYTRVLGGRIFALARYNIDGTLDASFGSGTGKVITTFYDISSTYEQANAIAVQTDGKIVVAGGVNNGTSRDFAVARYNTDGSLDTSFNNLDPFCFTGFICNGKQRTDFNSDADNVYAVVIRTDGKIVVAGYADSLIGGVDGDFALARYNANGRLDTSFGFAGTGKVTTPFYSGSRWINIARAMILQTDGKIVVAGKVDNGTNNDFALARYYADGTLDTSFNYSSVCALGNPCAGQVVTDFNGNNDVAYAITIQPIDNKIVVVGSASIGSGTDFALVRYNTDGTLDTSFGSAGSGKVTTNFGGTNNDVAHAVALQSDGKIVAAGYTHNGTNYTFALARYLP